MNFNFFSVLILFLHVSTFISCNEYQKLLNSDDASEKYKQAELYYNNGEYRKANRLFEQIIPKYRAKPQAQRIIFFFADSYFQTKSYYLASYQYESFIKSYPESDRIQEATFKAAKSYYFSSPKYSLDQKDTYTAIEKLQVFINLYPDSEFTAEANQMISELQEKLEQKDFEIAKQYFKIRDYRSAIRASEIFIAGFPGTKYREAALLNKFRASYVIAVNSVALKKLDRLVELQQQQEVILRYYPETLFLDELEDKMNTVNSEIEKYNQTVTTLTK